MNEVVFEEQFLNSRYEYYIEGCLNQSQFVQGFNPYAEFLFNT